MKKKAYIATRLENHVKHNEVRDALLRCGVELTYDWSILGPVWREGLHRIREVAELETNGVKEADFVVVILPGGRGTHAELGMALALEKQVYILAEGAECYLLRAVSETCAFYHHRKCIPVYSLDHLLNYVVTCEIRGEHLKEGK